MSIPKLCRLCMSTEDLMSLFNSSNINYESVSLTTGLTININDGLPQYICYECNSLVQSALKLRNQSRETEVKLIELGYTKNTMTSENCEYYNTNLNDDFYNNSLPDLSLDNDFKTIEELKTENTSNVLENNIKSDMEREISVTLKKKSKKERKEIYLNLVEGVLDPKGPVKCKVCKKTVNKWATFVNHAKLHLGLKYVCEFCGKSFISSTQLNRHCRSHHGMPRALPCRLCNYTALDNAQLLLHERRIHTGERPYVCDMCAAAYHSRRCLIQHLESHQTDTTVQCTKCPQMFKSRRHLARHTYTAHRSKEFTYKCPVCCHVYRNFKYIRVHLKKLHGLTTKEAQIIKIKL